uniref:BEN domain containing 7 n=1 Tax=Scleropages formosus TaxID=113540 RepID=A0A8C9VYG0_SCLFO
MEIKRQITGMMRLLNDKMCRRYRRTDGSRESLKLEPQDAELSWAEPGVTAQEDLQQSTWSLESTPKPQMAGQYGTRSRMLRMLNDSRNSVRSKGIITGILPFVVDPDPDLACCTCTCRSTLEAILQELRAVRKLMQTQRGQCRPTVALHMFLLPPYTDTMGSRWRKAVKTVEASGMMAVPHYYIIWVCFTTPEVQLADDYDVFISKSQLDSILVNYTRSGSLLFRKLVCAFFDDATLANSLPNGKRKRGLNDNRKGLDQNIVGAIKGRWSPTYDGVTSCKTHHKSKIS